MTFLDFIMRFFGQIAAKRGAVEFFLRSVG